LCEEVEYKQFAKKQLLWVCVEDGMLFDFTTGVIPEDHWEREVEPIIDSLYIEYDRRYNLW
jgi:hypothetical protein